MPLRVNKTKEPIGSFCVVLKNLASENYFPVSLLFILLNEQAGFIHFLDQLLEFRFFAGFHSYGINVLNRRIILDIYQGQRLFVECDSLF